MKVRLWRYEMTVTLRKHHCDTYAEHMAVHHSKELRLVRTLPDGFGYVNGQAVEFTGGLWETSRPAYWERSDED